MATITPRLISSRFISNPDDSTQGVKLKVIDGISFIDKRRRNQETTFRLINDPTAGRRVKVVNVGDLSTSTTGDRLLVERILNFSVVDRRSRAQESRFALINAADPLIHYRTHKTKVYATDADGNKDLDTWVEVQRIDQIWVRDPRNRGQDSIFTLVWKDVDDPEWDYTDVPEPTRDWDGTTINPPWRLDPFQNIVDASWGGLYLMVLYNGNSVAAISMSALEKATATGASGASGATGATGPLSVAYSKALEESSWGTGPMVTMQYRYSTDETVVYMPASFSETKIEVKNDYYLAITNKKFSDASLASSVASRTPKTPKTWNPNFTRDWIVPPIIINDGPKFYTSYDVYSILPSGASGYSGATGPSYIERKGDNAAFDNGGYPDPVFSITKKGENYYYIGAGFNFFAWKSLETSLYESELSFGWDKPLGALKSIRNLYNEITEAPTYYKDYIGYYKDLQAYIDFTYPTSTSDGLYVYYSEVEGKPRMSVPVPYFIIEQNSSIDVMTTSTETANIAMSGSYDAVTNVIDETRKTTFAGFELTHTYYGPVSHITACAWPPAYKGKPFFGVFQPIDETAVDWTWAGDLHTPYGTFTAEDGPRAQYGIGRINPLLHASNGKQVMQAFKVKTGPKFFANGKDIGDDLKTALGVELDKIQSVIMDVPLSRIKKFV